MDMQQRSADEGLRRAVAAFEQSVIAAPERPVSALAVLVGLLRAIRDLAGFALGVALDPDRTDPLHIEPRILRSA